MIFVGLVVAGVAAATGLVIAAMGENMLYFYSPDADQGRRSAERTEHPGGRAGGRRQRAARPRARDCVLPHRRGLDRRCELRRNPSRSVPRGTGHRGLGKSSNRRPRSAPRRSSPSTTRTTCRPKSRRPWRWRSGAVRCRPTGAGSNDRRARTSRAHPRLPGRHHPGRRTAARGVAPDTGVDGGGSLRGARAVPAARQSPISA